MVLDAAPRLAAVAGREDVGSWLERDAGSGSAPGVRLGLPASGPGSLAGAGRRVVALGVDWVACLLISGMLFPAAGAAAFSLVRGEPMATLGVFALENVLLVGTVGHTLGHRLLNLRVRTVALPVAGGPVAAPQIPAARSTDLGRTPGPLRALVRAALLLLVIPAVVRDGDGRGLHDRAAGTAIVRR